MAPKNRTTVSTTGMFRNNGLKPLPPGGSIRKATAKSSKNVHFKAPSKCKAPTPPHPLAQKLSATLSRSHDHILTTARTKLVSTHTSLLEQLSLNRSTMQDLQVSLSTLETELTRPLNTELLQFKDHEGRVSGTATLGERMRGFEELVKREERTLERLWAEWKDVQGEIEELVKGYDEGDGWDMGKEWVKEVSGRVREDLEREIRELGEVAMRKMGESEKVMDVRAKKQHEDVLTALRTQF